MSSGGHRRWGARIALLASCAAAGACTPASLRMSRTIDVRHEASETRFRVEYAPVDEDVAPAVRDAIEHALLRISKWGALGAPVVVRVYPDHESLIAAIGAHDYPWLRAWARYDEILLQSPRTWGIDYTTQLPELLTHELTHVVMYQRIAQSEDWEEQEVPLWFREGMASFTAQQGYRRGRPDEIAVSLRKAPDINPFRPSPSMLRDHKDLVYNSGHWSFSYLVRSGGEGRVLELLDHMRHGRRFDDAFERIYGRTQGEWLGSWRTMITGSAGDARPAQAPRAPAPGTPSPHLPAPVAEDPPGSSGDVASFKAPGCVPPPGPVPTSVGSPTRGELEDGRTFPNVPGVALMKRHVFATAETVALLLDAVAQVREAFPRTSPLALGHASRKGGGRLRPHASHQSGRDVDAAYYVKKPEDPPRWQVTNSRNLDAKRTWALFEALLSTGRVEYLFVDYGIQRALFKHALAAGTPKSRLETIFQYPNGRTWRRGLIRHESGHRDHFHVRFHCPMGDTACEPR